VKKIDAFKRAIEAVLGKFDKKLLAEISLLRKE